MVTYKDDGEKLICSFFGQMNTENCFKIQEDVHEKVRELKKPVIFDLKEVSYAASAFLSMCIWILKEAGSENFKLVNVNPDIKKVFRIAGLDKRINIA